MPDSLEEHYGYVSDRIKVARYETAIEQVVRPEHVIMDLGCGSGLLGLMALRAGARKVLFVEESAIIEVARQTVCNAGFADKAEFHRLNSFELSLRERVDVVLCDHVGYFGFDYGILALLADAKQRFLKPGGAIVPAEIGIWLAPVETKKGRTLVSRWRDGSISEDFAWIGEPAANTKHAIKLGSDSLLADPALLATLELGSEAEAFLSWQATLAPVRAGKLDGLLGWFDCRLAGDIRITNSPATTEDSLTRPQAFMPLEQSVALRKGELITAAIMARHLDHVLAWSIGVRDQRFSLTTFNGLLLDDEALNRSRPDRIAHPNARGRARQVILSYCDGQRTIAEIEALVQKEHPRLFPSAAATEKMIRHVLTWDTCE